MKKLRHRNSNEILDLEQPLYTKLYGLYGHLTCDGYFISDGGELYDSREEFEVIENDSLESIVK